MIWGPNTLLLNKAFGRDCDCVVGDTAEEAVKDTAEEVAKIAKTVCQTDEATEGVERNHQSAIAFIIVFEDSGTIMASINLAA